MKNKLKFNDKTIVVFSYVDGVTPVHTATINVPMHRMYFNPGTESFFNGAVDGVDQVKFDIGTGKNPGKYRGKFLTAIDFTDNELPSILYVLQHNEYRRRIIIAD